MQPRLQEGPSSSSLRFPALRADRNALNMLPDFENVEEVVSDQNFSNGV
jgi:hypothetical protein